MCAGQQHIDAEGIKVQWDGGHRTDAVHNEHHLGIFLLQLGDLLQRIHHSGGGFIVHEGDGVEFTGRELGVNGFRRLMGNLIHTVLVTC